MSEGERNRKKEIEFFLPCKLTDFPSGCCCWYPLLLFSPKSCPTLCDPVDCSPPGSHDKGLHRKKAAEEVRVSASSARDSEGTLRLETDPPQLLAPLLLVSHRPCPALLGPHGLQPARLLCPWGFPGKNAGVGCHFLLLGISLTLGSNLHLQLCRQILYC